VAGAESNDLGLTAITAGVAAPCVEEVLDVHDVFVDHSRGLEPARAKDAVVGRVLGRRLLELVLVEPSRGIGGDADLREERREHVEEVRLGVPDQDHRIEADDRAPVPERLEGLRSLGF
jgi:hypothetical protein